MASYLNGKLSLLLAIAAVGAVAIGYLARNTESNVISPEQQEVFTRFAIPPESLVPETRFVGAEFEENLSQKTLSFVYVLRGPDISKQAVGAWLTEVMKPQTMMAICNQSIIAKKAWYVTYQYADPDDYSIAYLSISRRDCRAVSN